jgi:hypothetical protein
MEAAPPAPGPHGAARRSSHAAAAPFPLHAAARARARRVVPAACTSAPRADAAASDALAARSLLPLPAQPICRCVHLELDYGSPAGGAKEARRTVMDAGSRPLA